jgi:hypothetical protein
MTKSDQHEALTETARDYFEGWFDGDVARMDRVLHPGLVKRRGQPGTLAVTTKQRMLELTAQGAGAEDAADRSLDIEVLEVSGDIASVRVRSAAYHEYLHLVRTPGGWQIANALWRAR